MPRWGSPCASSVCAPSLCFGLGSGIARQRNLRGLLIRRRERGRLHNSLNHFRLVLDHAFQGLPQHRDVGGVWFVLQRSEDAPSDGGNVGVARPTGDGEAIRDLDQVPVGIGERVLVIAHRRPRHREPSGP